MNADEYQVNDIFTSIQGEGYWTGRRATFIRLQGCPVGCSWCDAGPNYHPDTEVFTQLSGNDPVPMHVPSQGNTWGKGGTRMTVDEIMVQVKSEYVVITGGEPMIWNLDPLLERLLFNYVSIETSGLNWYKGLLGADWITWSPKENLGWDAPIEFYQHASELKWVVDEALQYETVTRVWNKCLLQSAASINPYAKVPFNYLMPEGCPPSPAMVAKALGFLEQNFTHPVGRWRFGDRLQYRIGVK